MLIALFSMLSLLGRAQESGFKPDSLHIIIDGSLPDAYVGKHPFYFNSFQKAAEHFTGSTSRQPVEVYIRPGVYWIDNPDTPAVAVGKGGREPFGMTIRCKNLRLIGLSPDARDVVLASQRGQMQGAVGNFTMFDFWVDSLEVSNLTMGNYCNVDLEYPLNPRLNRKKRSDAITQAHVGYVHGKSLVARNVRFISRLNLNPLNGAARALYEHCHFECTDDALTGNGVYRHCTIDLYGSKPFYSTHGRGAVFIDCDFTVKTSNREMYFCKQGGPLALIDCRYHAPEGTRIEWAPYPQRWLRCYQKNFTLNGKPYRIGSLQPANTVVADSVSSDFIVSGRLDVSSRTAVLRSGGEPLVLIARSSGAPVRWRIEKGFAGCVSLSDTLGPTVRIIPDKDIDETARFCVVASVPSGLEAACELTVEPRILPPPAWRQRPRIRLKDGQAVLDYRLELDGLRDETEVTWVRCLDRDKTPHERLKESHGATAFSYRLTGGDAGHRLAAIVRPKSHRSNAGDTVVVFSAVVGQRMIPDETVLETDFRGIPCSRWPVEIAPGTWTADGYKPADTAEFSWSFDRQKPMWVYGEGFNGAKGTGLLQAQRGARLMYTPVRGQQGDMSLTLLVDPTKTAGQGFGSATGQYMDVCIKFDTHTLTGYGLRIIRTAKHAKAVDFYLVEYRNGEVKPLTSPISSICYRTGCTIRLTSAGNRLAAHVETATPLPAESPLARTVDLSAEIAPNAHGGVHIQHTGSCGESTTMLHYLKVEWMK